MSAVSWKELITTRVFYSETLVFILFCDIVTFWLLPLSILPHCCCFFIMFITGFLVSVFSCASASRSVDVLLLTSYSSLPSVVLVCVLGFLWSVLLDFESFSL